MLHEIGGWFLGNAKIVIPIAYAFLLASIWIDRIQTRRWVAQRMAEARAWEQAGLATKQAYETHNLSRYVV